MLPTAGSREHELILVAAVAALISQDSVPSNHILPWVWMRAVYICEGVYAGNSTNLTKRAPYSPAFLLAIGRRTTSYYATCVLLLQQSTIIHELVGVALAKKVAFQEPSSIHTQALSAIKSCLCMDMV